MPPAQRSLASDLGGTGEFRAVDHLGGAELLEVFGLLRTPGRSDHLVTELGEQRDRDGTDPSGRPGHQHRRRCPA